MKNFIALLVFACSLQACTEVSNPTFNEGEDPKPEGQKWVLIEQLSDEFEGEKLDETKWKNTDASAWIGRPPGIFKEDVVTLDNSNLRLTNYQLPKAEVIRGNTFTHAGGHISSHQALKPGYYTECRMKANKTFMSSTFWLINNTREGQDCDKRVTELDIQECVGTVTSTTKWAEKRYQKMGSNTHSRNTACADTPVGSWGNDADLLVPAYDDYHVYAAWWKNESEILFFLDGKHVYTVNPEAKFNLPMYLRMVTETYDWNPTPKDGGMTGSWEDRTTSYDWVRTWKLETI